ncbi:hypothetical protein BX600DRAFT_170679 [Xylariales sp. PMI_506]|nr:hypothetical protein BX600DRAFT_170679 [Xylariales sp. PMI_506]
MASQDEATQQATQTALDPRRLGQQNSGFSDDDICDIVCLLYPNTENASREIERIANTPGCSHHITGRFAADAVDADLELEDDPRQFGRTGCIGDHAIVLKMSSIVKSPQSGFTFGRNQQRCDIYFANDPLRRLSNIHFRIFVNRHGVVMLEDQSTNGTIVDDVMLKKKRDSRDDRQSQVTRMLNSGSTIKILMHENAKDIVFLVRIPRRDGDFERRYRENLHAYLQRTQGYVDLDRTLGPIATGPVNLFPPSFHDNGGAGEITQQAGGPSDLLPRELRGAEKFNRQSVIGKGAFATVWKVTHLFTGEPYAAKELDKRKFMKNGILDQKVENEMKIMQRVHHANIVRYIDHFDWGQHQFVIVMEYIPGGDLGKLVLEVGNLEERLVKSIAKQLIDALGYLHENKITHRDVKPDNILIQSKTPLVVKLTDFGLSKMIDTEQTFLKTFCGTLLYCAPEVYSEYSSYDEKGRRVRQRDRKNVNRERYDHAIDVWSLGGVLFYALTGVPPFPVRNGTTYTELLHHIMTNPLNTDPLRNQRVSANGIDFITSMIDRRPETRATIAELQSHPWLTDDADPKSDDEISDDGLEQGASQLSLIDRLEDPVVDGMGTSVILEPEPDYSSMDFEDDKENYTFGQLQPGRLWGEVNHSAIGSSGAIGEDRLNIPMSVASTDETEVEGRDSLDSFGSPDLSTPRQPKAAHPRNILASTNSMSNVNSRSIALGIASQSLGGDSAILENLNMKSLAPGPSNFPSEITDFNTSKRKPAYDTSDEYDNPSSQLRPNFKRFKSLVDDDLVANQGPDYYALLASVPQAITTESARRIDNPVHKATFWKSDDKETWHLNYPEMTHSQYNAFETAAKKRGEEFYPFKTALWDIAMEWFPPVNARGEIDDDDASESRPILRRDSRSIRDSTEWDMPPTAPPPLEEADLDPLPDTLPSEARVPRLAANTLSSKTVVARLTSSSESLVKGIIVPITDPLVSWGRAHDNTLIYPEPKQSKVPKHAFRILLWRDGPVASSNEFRPWDRGRSPASMASRASPEPDSYAFYISTKATSGLRINNNPLQSNEPRDITAPSKYWMRLYHGDTVVCWGTEDVNNQTKLGFECFWGGSSGFRPADEPPTCVPDAISRKLDAAWTRAERNLHHDRTKDEATKEWQHRMQNPVRELDRARKFELKRAEALKILAARRRPSNEAVAATTTTAAAPAAISPPPPVSVKVKVTQTLWSDGSSTELSADQ